jgi:multiple antibiotic resistance protein
MDLLSTTILLLIIMDPLGNIPVFHALVGHYPRRRRLWIIGREMLLAYLLLLGVLAAGEPVLRYLGLEQPALGVAGGVVLFIIALRMVFPEHHAIEPSELGEEPLIVPLAIPLIAGPSAIAALLLLVSREPDRIGSWVAALTVAWLISAAVLLASGLLMERLGVRALRALARLAGMILIMIAVQMLMDSIAIYVVGLSNPG